MFDLFIGTSLRAKISSRSGSIYSGLEARSYIMCVTVEAVVNNAARLVPI
jgi:hypothetical protein